LCCLGWVVTGTAGVDDDRVAFYLGYYNLSLLPWLYVLDLRIVRIFV
jgi:hypothetical protein